jgi:trimeric autotransporter adhesin
MRLSGLHSPPSHRHFLENNPMLNSLKTALVAVAMFAAAPPAAAAQSDILLRLRSGSPAGDRFRVDSAGSVVALTNLGIGIIPATGCGERMMWYSYKAAFRAGSTDDNGACAYWDDSNVGFFSWAGGNLTIAGAYAAFAFGDGVTVTGLRAAGFGQEVTVAGNGGFATGYRARCYQFMCNAQGYYANADGQYSIALGHRVTADADYAVAIGYRASTNGFDGTFVIADASTTDSLEASATNQFNSRYAGGYRLYTNATTTTGVSLNAGGSSWNVISDRNRKELFLPVDRESVLARIRGIPVSTWRYIDEQDRSVRHMGPMAQDWQRAFGFSGDSTTINSGDFDGVNFAGVQALEIRTGQQANQIHALRAENQALRGEVEVLRAVVDALRGQNERIEQRLRLLEERDEP